MATPLQRNLPTIITLSRIAVTPFISLAIYIGGHWGEIAAAVIFVIGAATDYYDGYFARIWQVESNFGRLMDPVADKILVSVTLIMLLPIRAIDPVMVSLLLSRDLIIGGIRAAAAADHLVISAKAFGKWKTGLQMSCIPMILLNRPIAGVPTQEIGYWGLWLSVGFSVISAIQYCFQYRAAIVAKNV